MCVLHEHECLVVCLLHVRECMVVCMLYVHEYVSAHSCMSYVQAEARGGGCQTSFSIILHPIALDKVSPNELETLNSELTDWPQVTEFLVKGKD